MTKKIIKKHFSLIIFCFIIVFSILLLPKFIDFLHHTFVVLAYPYAWALTENENMLFIHGILSGTPVYKLENTGIFNYFVYPPFFHLISAFFIQLFGFTILIPRILSVISFFILAYFLWIFYKEKIKFVENTLVTFILVASTVSVTLYSMYYVIARVDMPSYAFAFASIFFLWKIVYLKEEKNRNYIFAGILAICALFTKQSVFFPYFVIALLFFFYKNKKKWFLFGLSVGLATAAVFLTLNFFTQGEFLKSMNLAREIYGKHLMSIRHLLWLQDTYISHYIGFLIGGIFILRLSVYRITKKKLPAFSGLLLIAVAINFYITGGNGGAAYNTLIPVVFCMMFVMKELYTARDTIKLRRFAQTLFVVLIIWELFLYNKYIYPYNLPSETDRKNQATLVETLKTSSGTWVVGDRIDYAIILAGKESPLEASTHYNVEEYKNTNGYATAVEKNLIDRLKKKKISTAVITISNFGKGELYSYITSKGTIIKSYKMNYMDAGDLEHKVYIFNDK